MVNTPSPATTIKVATPCHPKNILFSLMVDNTSALNNLSNCSQCAGFMLKKTENEFLTYIKKMDVKRLGFLYFFPVDGGAGLRAYTCHVVTS